MSKGSLMGPLDSAQSGDGQRPKADAHTLNAAASPRTTSTSNANGALASVTRELDGAIAAGGSLAVSEDVQRIAYIAQILEVCDDVLAYIADGHSLALTMLATPDAPRDANTRALLVVAASAAIAGIAGPAALVAGKWIGSRLGGGDLVKKALEDTVKDGLKAAAKSGASGPAGDMDLRDAFAEHLQRCRRQAKSAMTAQTSSRMIQLASVPLASLAAIADRATARAEAGADQVVAQAIDRTLIAWTNFVARARFGGMGPWDLWARNGGPNSFALDGAQPAPADANEAKAATAQNVAPEHATRMYNTPSEQQGGLLEISLGRGFLTDGRGMNFGHDYGMRLANVGPKVRARIRTMGRVRDVSINKLVRLYEVHSHSVSRDGSILITADGYVRATDLGSRTLVHPRGPLTVKQQFGLDEAPPMLPKFEANEAIARDIAEFAQNLPLTLLED